ncbi:protoplasts-secreted [Umbelopsis sp. WA50703]
MVWQQLVLLVTILIAAVQAQSCSGQAIITSQADLDNIESCSSYDGTISIDGTNVESLDMDGIQRISGDLIMRNNDNLNSFNAPALQSIRGQLEMSNQTRLSQFTVPNLKNVSSITLAVLPQLDDVSFVNALSGLSTISIADTLVQSIQNPYITNLRQLRLTNNNNLTTIQLDKLSKVEGKLYVTANGPSCSAEFPKLTSIQSATFRNLNNINLPALTVSTQDISFNQNLAHDLKLDALISVGGSLIVVDNNELSNLTMSNLTTIGGAFAVGNNTKLLAIDGFPKLQEVKGTVDFAGAFDKANIPALKNVRGEMRLQTTSTVFKCNDIKSSQVVNGGSLECKSNLAPNQIDSTFGQNGKGASSGAQSGSASSSLALAACMAFIIII